MLEIRENEEADQGTGSKGMKEAKNNGDNRDGLQGDIKAQISVFRKKDTEERIGGQHDLSHGPLTDRRCTDVYCTVLWVLHILAFFLAFGLSLGDGSPKKLFVPRDFRGDFCGLSLNGKDMTQYDKVVYTMNTSGTVAYAAQRMLCSSPAQTALEQLLTITELEDYMCGCCKTPCARCTGVSGLDDFSNPRDASNGIGDMMTDLTSPANALSLLSVNGPNGGAFTSVFNQMDKFFHRTCATSCQDVLYAGDEMRTYVYSPDYDDLLLLSWNKLKGSTGDMATTIQTKFSFKALPTSMCNYEPRYCVPFPGMQFSELTLGWCSFDLASDVGGMLGQTSPLSGAGNATSVDIASQMGDIMQTMDVAAVTFVLSFVAAMVFLIVLRFVIGIVIWTALGMTVVFFFMSGFFSYLKSGQCVGDTYTDTAMARANTAAQQAARNAAVTANKYSAQTGQSYSVVDLSWEGLTGNGEDYNGVQSRSKTGRPCQRWDKQIPHKNGMLAKYPDKNLTENYCRNPNGAVYIWCYTRDEDVRWELCRSLDDTSFGETCPTGFVVESEWMRTALWWIGIFLQIFSMVWILGCLLLYRKIQRAIAIIKVSADFVVQKPQIVLVPIVQGMVAACWLAFWAFCASFILSSVAVDFFPTEKYATYGEAYGTAEVPGKCNDRYPSGFVWKYGGDILSENDPCSGNKGDISGITPRCWACGNPRYSFDYKFAFAWFSLLWNNALLIAVGQCTIAGTAAFWFFSPFKEGTKKKEARGGLRNALTNTFWYHFGSMCFGSFILAAVQFIRYCMMYLEKQAAAQKNRFTVMILKVAQCCIRCLERFIKFLNKTAYIQIAIEGETFCMAAYHGFGRVLRNLVLFGLISYFGKIVVFIGKAFLIMFTGLSGYMMLQGMDPNVNPVAPVCLFLVSGWLVGELVMDVYGLALDTCLHCQIVAEENCYPADTVPPDLAKFIPPKAERQSMVAGKVQGQDEKGATAAEKESLKSKAIEPEKE
eukprot:TRINITY_DN80333_c0_g1_i1.p1 TRINITY_DN80333_c0_g1~~TRINITY_DN80333_c0_g1_i1.p1  ORF type:complete len:993 (+),score=215.16 TRINITY_DN80333_c0_g1_i1:83-3061(+)